MRRPGLAVFCLLAGAQLAAAAAGLRASESVLGGEGAFGHLRALQAIAAEHGGNRAAGTAGYDRSAEYVAGRLREAGLEVRFEEFSFPFFEERTPPVLEAAAGRPAAPDDLRTLANSAAGEVTARLHAVDLGLSAHGPPPPSTSGCEASDFEGFVRGAIALLRRGTCTFQAKLDLATAAGASAVIVMNEGVEGRIDVVSGRVHTASIPVVGVSFALGQALEAQARQEDSGVVRLVVDALAGVRQTRNVVAQPNSGEADTIVVGAHLDSVAAGPGINDNGSGTAAVLEAALRFARAGGTAGPQVRFGFWGAEEVGLIGSRHHLTALSDAERQRIKLYINLDMVGSPNFGRFVQGAQGDHDSLAARSRRTLVEAFRSRGLAVEERSNRGLRGYGSDDASFAQKGIPTLGLYTGAGEHKPEDKAGAFGGAAGRPYDPCYHRACDTLENIDRGVLEQMTDALAQTLAVLAGPGAPALRAVDPSSGDVR